jgi:hypothetical protein
MQTTPENTMNADAFTAFLIGRYNDMQKSQKKMIEILRRRGKSV